MWSRFTGFLLLYFSILTIVLISVSVAIIVFAPVTDKSVMYDKLAEYKSHIVSHDDIVVIGDSTGLSGVNPLICKPREVTNLCLYGHAKPLGWYNILLNYLENNKTPRLCVIYFTAPTPSTFRVQHYEEIYIKFRYFKVAAFKEYSLDYNPFDATGATLTILSKAIFEPQVAEPSPISFVRNHKGYMAFYGELAASPMNSAHSHGAKSQDLHNGLEAIIDLKRKIEKLGIRVLIYLHAIPEHDEALTFYKSFYQGYVDNPIYTLPHKNFNDHTHLNDRGAQVNTKIFLKFLEHHGF